MIPTILAAALWLTGGTLIAALIEELDGPSTRGQRIAVVAFWPLVAAASIVQAGYDYAVRTYKGL